MSNEEFVKQYMPKAKVERQVRGRIAGEVYYLVRDGRNNMYFASGETKTKAWKKAKEKILELGLEKP